MPTRPHPLAPLVAALLVLAAPAYAAYTASATATASAETVTWMPVWTNVADNPVAVTQSTAGVGPVAAVLQAGAAQRFPGIESVSSSLAAASVRPGEVHLLATADARATFNGGPAPLRGMPGSFSKAEGGYSEQFIWNVDGLAPGTMVNVDIGIRLDGGVGISSGRLGGGDSFGQIAYSWGFQLTSAGWGAGGGYLSNMRWYGVSNGELLYDQTDFGLHSFTMTLMVGSPMQFSLWGYIQSFARADSGVDFNPGLHEAATQAVGDLAHTLSWGGVLGLRDGNGAAIDLSRLSIDSDSGADYLHAINTVPEPASLALFALGAAALALHRRRRPAG